MKFSNASIPSLLGTLFVIGALTSHNVMGQQKPSPLPNNLGTKSNNTGQNAKNVGSDGPQAKTISTLTPAPIGSDRPAANAFNPAVVNSNSMQSTGSDSKVNPKLRTVISTTKTNTLTRKISECKGTKRLTRNDFKTNLEFEKYSQNCNKLAFSAKNPTITVKSMNIKTASNTPAFFRDGNNDKKFLSNAKTAKDIKETKAQLKDQEVISWTNDNIEVKPTENEAEVSLLTDDSNTKETPDRSSDRAEANDEQERARSQNRNAQAQAEPSVEQCHSLVGEAKNGHFSDPKGLKHCCKNKQALLNSLLMDILPSEDKADASELGIEKGVANVIYSRISRDKLMDFQRTLGAMEVEKATRPNKKTEPANVGQGDYIISTRGIDNFYKLVQLANTIYDGATVEIINEIASATTNGSPMGISARFNNLKSRLNSDLSTLIKIADKAQAPPQQAQESKHSASQSNFIQVSAATQASNMQEILVQLCKENDAILNKPRAK